MRFSNCPACQGLIQETDEHCPICRTPVGAVAAPALARSLPPPPSQAVVPAGGASMAPVAPGPPPGYTAPPAPPGYAAPSGPPPGYAAPPAGYGAPPYGPPPGPGAAYEAAPGFGPPGWPAGPQAKPKASRAKIVIAVSVVTVVLGLALIGGSILLLGRSAYPSSWDPRVVDITSFVERSRGLDYKHPVYVDFLTEDEFNQTVTKSDSSLSDSDRDELKQAVEQGRAEGLLQGDVDLVAQSNQLQTSGTLAFYDPKTKHVRVRGTTLDVAHKVTLAHELTHALQDQYFDLSKLGQLPTDEARTAFRTVVEGDAVRVENEYVDQLSSADQNAYKSQSKAGRDAATAGIASVPDVLVASISAPYTFGTPFLSVLEAKGGNTTINDSFDTPPPNEAQIVDPEDFFAHQKTASPKEPEVPQGAEKITPSGQSADEPTDDHLGSLDYFMMLSARVDPHQALRALDVWNGDALVRYRQAGRLCIKAAVAVDDTDAVAKVAPILDQWRDNMPAEADASVEKAGTTFTITSCDPGAAADAKISGKPSEALVLPNIRLSIWAAALKGKVPGSQAACIAKTFTDQLPLAEATSENPDQDDLAQRVSAAKTACV